MAHWLWRDLPKNFDASMKLSDTYDLLFKEMALMRDNDKPASGNSKKSAIDLRERRKEVNAVPLPFSGKINRDLLISLTEMVLFRNKFLTQETIRCLFVNDLMRQVALDRLSRLKYFAFYHNTALISEKHIKHKGGYRLYVQCDKNGLKLLRFLIETVLYKYESFITNVMISRMPDTNQCYMLETLCLLRGITELTLSLDSSSPCIVAKSLCSELIEKNAETLCTLRHVDSPKMVPRAMQPKIVMVRHAALYFISNQQESICNHFSFYTKNSASIAKITSPLKGLFYNENDEDKGKDGMKTVQDTVQDLNNCTESNSAFENANTVSTSTTPRVTMRLSLLVIEKIFDFIESSFLQQMVTDLNVRLVYKTNENKLQSVLDEIWNWKKTWPNLESAELHIEIRDEDPRNDGSDIYGEESEDEDLRPNSMYKVKKMSHQCREWLQTHNNLPFRFKLGMTHCIEYNISRNEEFEKFEEEICEMMTKYYCEFSLKQTKEQSARHLELPTLIGETYFDERRTFEMAVDMFLFRFFVAKKENLNKCAENCGIEDKEEEDELDELDELICARDFSLL